MLLSLNGITKNGKINVITVDFTAIERKKIFKYIGGAYEEQYKNKPSS